MPLTEGKCGKTADADEGCTPGPRRPPPRFGMNHGIHTCSVVVSNCRAEDRIKGGRFFLKSASFQTLTNMEGRAECRPLVDGMRIAAVGDAYG